MRPASWPFLLRAAQPMKSSIGRVVRIDMRRLDMVESGLAECYLRCIREIVVTWVQRN